MQKESDERGEDGSGHEPLAELGINPPEKGTGTAMDRIENRNGHKHGDDLKGAKDHVRHNARKPADGEVTRLAREFGNLVRAIHSTPVPAMTMVQGAMADRLAEEIEAAQAETPTDVLALLSVAALFMGKLHNDLLALDDEDLPHLASYRVGSRIVGQAMVALEKLTGEHRNTFAGLDLPN